MVTVRARGEAVNGLDQVAIPLMVPGLPVYLWWRVGRFAPAPWLDGILRSVDRVLIDSAQFSDPETDFAQLAGQIRRFPDVMFTDLNWARLTAWRELIAGCFDSPQTRPYLDRLDEVRIEYELHSPRTLVHRAQSLLITGWLASRLGWTFMPGPTPPGTQSEEGPFLFHAGDREVRVERQPRDFKGGGAGVCMALTLKTTGAAPATFSVARGPDGRTARTCRAVPGQPQLESAVRLQVLDEVELLKGEIRFAARDRVYEETLDAAARLRASSP
jgi:glucose-6-phosphate dehydrogenase assembly protein OpcA